MGFNQFVRAETESVAAGFSLRFCRKSLRRIGLGAF